MGRARDHDIGARIPRGGARDDALCRLSFPSRDAIRRPRQSGGDAGGLGTGDAGGHARPARDAVRLRRGVLVVDGPRHRLDDCGHAMGGGVARRGRTGAGIRHRPVDRRQSRHRPARAVAHAAALVGRCAGAVSGAVGGEGAAAGHFDLC